MTMQPLLAHERDKCDARRMDKDVLAALQYGQNWLMDDDLRAAGAIVEELSYVAPLWDQMEPAELDK